MDERWHGVEVIHDMQSNEFLNSAAHDLNCVQVIIVEDAVSLIWKNNNNINDNNNSSWMVSAHLPDPMHWLPLQIVM